VIQITIAAGGAGGPGGAGGIVGVLNGDGHAGTRGSAPGVTIVQNLTTGEVLAQSSVNVGAAFVSGFGSGGANGGTGGLAGSVTRSWGYASGKDVPITTVAVPTIPGGGGNGGAGGPVAGGGANTLGVYQSNVSEDYGVSIVWTSTDPVVNPATAGAAGTDDSGVFGTSCGGGGGGAGGSSTTADEYPILGQTPPGPNDGRGGSRAGAEGNGSNGVYIGIPFAATAGANGMNGVGGRGGGGGQGGGGGAGNISPGSASNGAAGGTGGDGCDALVSIAAA
jgi:hypothetical protein